jgi:hypothetical protein
MIVTTMNDIPGYVVDEVFGEVMGLTVRSRHVGSQLGAQLKSIVGGELKGMTKALVESRRDVEGRERNHRHALRHVGDGCDVDGDLRLRHGGARSQELSSRCLAPLRVSRTELLYGRVVKRDAVAPEGPARGEQPLAQRSGELGD